MMTGAEKAPQRLEPGCMRCAIYTRKSTEEGLDREFNSLEAQRDAAESFIASQRHLSWQVVPRRYDDGGYTGANLERPGLSSLLEDIEAGTINCVVVYKVDRLSRSLLDFARLMTLFDKRSVNLVAVTQPFNTTTSVGRLTLNVLLSFAQFEREMIAERTRDKMAAARRRGKWTGGRPPLGYEVAAGGRPAGGEPREHPSSADHLFELPGAQVG
jgi:site-specific DNA recombinase